jgi:hypothetical protein
MTTFTLQDLTPEQQQAVTKHEEMHRMFQQMGGDLTGGKSNVFDAPTTQPTVTKEEWMEYGMNNPINISPTTENILNNMAIPQAPEPQPSEIDPIKLIDEMMAQFSIKLKLLATVINQSKTQPTQGNSLNAGENSLQECVSLTLQQADWFKEMVRGIIDDTYDFEAHAEGAVETVVEKEVEHYFDHGFNPEDHFDFADAVSDAVDDRLDDIVSDKIDDVVQEKFDDFMENATITINR